MEEKITIPEDLERACRFLFHNEDIDLPGAIVRVQRIGFNVHEVREFEEAMKVLGKYFPKR